MNAKTCAANELLSPLALALGLPDGLPPRILWSRDRQICDDGDVVLWGDRIAALMPEGLPLDTILVGFHFDAIEACSKASAVDGAEAAFRELGTSLLREILTSADPSNMPRGGRLSFWPKRSGRDGSRPNKVNVGLLKEDGLETDQNSSAATQFATSMAAWFDKTAVVHIDFGFDGSAHARARLLHLRTMLLGAQTHAE